MDASMAGSASADGNKVVVGERGDRDGDGAVDRHICRVPSADSRYTDYKCLICQKSCKSRDDCANHIEVHHLKISRGCPYCGMEQTSRGGLRQHISRKHREEHRLAKEKAKIAQVGDLA